LKGKIEEREKKKMEAMSAPSPATAGLLLSFFLRKKGKKEKKRKEERKSCTPQKRKGKYSNSILWADAFCRESKRINFRGKKKKENREKTKEQVYS